MLRKLCVLSSLFFVLALSARAQDSRHFTFHYAFTVRNLPAGKKVRIWIPAAQSDAYQEVKIICAKGDLPLKKTVESKYGNQIYYAEAASAQPELHFDVEYEVTRHERVALGQTAPRVIAVSLSSTEKRQDLQSDVLVPVTGLPADLAVKVTQGRTDQLDKARAIYDYVFTTMRYDKTGTGWGHGDVLYACDAKKGNCTDFHSLFSSLSIAAMISLNCRTNSGPIRLSGGLFIMIRQYAGETRFTLTCALCSCGCASLDDSFIGDSVGNPTPPHAQRRRPARRCRRSHRQPRSPLHPF